ncbi:cadherin-related family member 3 [Eublepharis macularius]|uniref:Cadherin-related family member 3 n=1 Tax=Eublepharis macularius TaxID=481883 RepID=A0AA97L782_EUBMA|nr:cadherin-related family member 3 [Eublepharis macularius]
MLCFCLILLLGEISGGRMLSFVGLPGTGKVKENSPAGASIYTFNVSLSPSNAPVNGYPKIINTNPLTKAFRINAVSSLQYIVATSGDPMIDYETMPHTFDLQILVRDSAGAKAVQILTIVVLDENEPPVFLGDLATQTVMVYVMENKPAGIIYQLHAFSSENTTSTRIFYSLTPVEPFSISQTGTISSSKAFDFEKDPHSYSLNITVTNGQGLSTSGTVIINIININDETPYFNMTKSVFGIKEEERTGTIVTTITAVDPDNIFDDSLRYRITAPQRIPYFSINPENGVIRVARRLDRDIEPLKLHPNISLEILVEDSPNGGQSNSITIVISVQDINDLPPECQQYNFRQSFLENISTGTIIFDLKNSCQDHDAVAPNNLFNFTGLSGVGSHKFAQDPPGSGRIKLVGNVDLENQTDGAVKDYILNIVVQDIVSPFYPNNIYIYVRILPVNEFIPVFSHSSYVFNASEIIAVKSIIGTVTATDKDVPSTGISYSIVAGGGTRDYSEVFWIDPKDGRVEIVAQLDYETSQRYLLTIQASDNEGYTATVSVTVNVLEANDEKPVCSTNSRLLQIPVSLTPGTNINGFYISCVDRDSSPRSFRYTINSGNVNNHFAFSPSAGSGTSWLILLSPFDYEGGLDRVWEYRLEVLITDDNLLSVANRATTLIQTGTVTFTVKVIPNPTTVIPTTPGVTLVTSRENVYFASAWYVPFIVSLGSLLLLGLLGYLTFLLAKYIRTHCQPKPKEDKKPLIKTPEKKKVGKEVVWEMTNVNAVFDGEARDPVTGHMYEFNSKSGARRWKNTNRPLELEAKDPETHITAIRTSTGQGNLVSGEQAGTSARKQGRQDNKMSAPPEQKIEISDQDNDLKLRVPKEKSLANGSTVHPSTSPALPRRSPMPSPKIYPKYQSQA